MDDLKNLNKSSVQYLQVFLIALGIMGFQLTSNLPEVLNVESRNVTIPYRGFYFLLCILSLINNRIKINSYSNFYPVFLFIFLYFIRSIYDTLFAYDIPNSTLVDFWLFAYFIGFLPFFTLLAQVNILTLAKARYYLFILTILVNVLSFLSNYGSLNSEIYGARLLGNEIMNEITYGQSGVIMVIISLCLYYDKLIKYNFLLFPLICLGLFNIALAGSRGPFIELIVTISSFFIFNFRKIGIWNVFFGFLVMIFIGLYFKDYLIFFDTTLDRLNDTTFNNGSESEERYYLFQEAQNQFFNNPILGYRAIGIYPHNLILESFSSLGILGGVILIIITFQSIILSINMIKNPSLNWIGLIFLLHIVSTFISGAIWNSFEFWTLLGLSISINKNKLYKYE
jgi:hypothetical protein